MEEGVQVEILAEGLEAHAVLDLGHREEQAVVVDRFHDAVQNGREEYPRGGQKKHDDRGLAARPEEVDQGIYQALGYERHRDIESRPGDDHAPEDRRLLLLGLEEGEYSDDGTLSTHL